LSASGGGTSTRQSKTINKIAPLHHQQQQQQHHLPHQLTHLAALTDVCQLQQSENFTSC